jgi:hypothetical protein
VRAILQAPDAKKEEFRAYLSKAGVIDALTKGALPAAHEARGTDSRGAWSLVHPRPPAAMHAPEGHHVLMCDLPRPRSPRRSV